MLSKWISWLHGHTTRDTRVSWMVRDVQGLYVSRYVGFVSRFSATFHAFPVLGLSQEHLGRDFFLNGFKNQSWNIEHYGYNSSLFVINSLFPKMCLQSMTRWNMLPQSISSFHIFTTIVTIISRMVLNVSTLYVPSNVIFDCRFLKTNWTSPSFTLTNLISWSFLLLSCLPFHFSLIKPSISWS